MGIYAHRFYFAHGLPKVKAIKEKFREITGLQVYFYAKTHLDALAAGEDDILYDLNSQRADGKHTGIQTPYFTCADFNHVYLEEYMDSKDKTFYLEFGAGKVNKYFYKAMIKTMLEIGGQTYTNHIAYEGEENAPNFNQFLEPYFPHEPRWMQIKPWDTLSEFERNRFL